MSRKILTGGILFALLLAFLLSAAIYHRFTATVTRYYEIDALRTAQTALTFLDVENFSEYSQDESKRYKVENAWQRLANTQGATFIYAIEPQNNYNHIRFIIDVENENAGYYVKYLGNENDGEEKSEYGIYHFENHNVGADRILCNRRNYAVYFVFILQR